MATDAVTEEAAERTQDRRESQRLTDVQGDCKVLQEGETSDKPLAETPLTKRGEMDDVDDRSLASSQTRSASASSTSFGDGSDMDHDYEPGKAPEGPSPEEVVEPVSSDERAKKITDETPVMEDGHDNEDVGDGGKRDEKTEDTAASDMEELKAKLESLNRGDWNGSVDVVLDKIEELSQWISVDEPVKQQSSEESDVVDQVGAARVERGADGAKLDGNKRNGAMERKDSPNKVAGEEIGDEDVGREGQSGGESEQEEGEEEDDEDDEGDGDESGEDGEGGDDSEQFVEDEDEIFSAQQHPLLREQRVLRAQWRRLLLDAELEPETSIVDLVRSEVVTMFEAIPDAVEEARREAMALPGGTPVTPRQRPVLRYDEVRHNPLIGRGRRRLAADGIFGCGWHVSMSVCVRSGACITRAAKKLLQAIDASIRTWVFM